MYTHKVNLLTKYNYKFIILKYWRKILSNNIIIIIVV